jgi:hypothetical protein
MFRKIALLSVFLAGGACAHAAEPLLPLDLIPAESFIGISIRNLAELKKKGDKLLGERKDILRPSEAFAWLLQHLGLAGAIDEGQAVAALCVGGTMAGFGPNSDPQRDFRIVSVVSFKDLDALARVYGVGKTELKPGQAIKLPKKADIWDRLDGWGFLKGQHLILGETGAAVTGVGQAQALRQTVPEARRQRLDRADALIYFGPPLLAVAKKNANPDWTPPELVTPEEKKAQHRLNRAFLDVRSVLGAVHLNDGLGLDLTATAEKGGAAFADLLNALSAGGRTANLNGLPEGTLVAALGGVGLGEEHAILSRAAVRQLLPGLTHAEILSAADQGVAVGVIADISRRLLAGRVGLYQAGNTARDGQVAVVAILDTEDPKRFLQELGQLARFGDAGQIDVSVDKDREDIQALIKQLGDESYAVRETASTKLGLVGERALPFLEKAEKSDDAEVARRAKELREAIAEAVELRKKEIKLAQLPRRFRPAFRLMPAAETRDGTAIDMIRMRFDVEDTPYLPLLKQLLGPSWDRIRLAVHGKQVVALIGSDLGLFDQALANVKQGKPGLAEAPALAGFRQYAGPGRKLEAHANVGLLQALVMPADKLPKNFKPGTAISSVSLRTGANNLGLDLWVPTEMIDGVWWWLR